MKMTAKTKDALTTTAIFLACAVIGWLLALHFRHTLLETFFFSNSQTADTYSLSASPEVLASADYATEQAEFQGDEGCGCPTCCALSL